MFAAEKLATTHPSPNSATACIAWYPSLSALRRATDGASLCNSLTYALQGTEELAWGALIHHCYEAQIQAPAALLLQGWEMKDSLAAMQYFSVRLIPKMGAEREIRPSPQSHSPTSPQGERVEEQKAAPYTVWYTRVLTFINLGGYTNCIWQWIFEKNNATTPEIAEIWFAKRALGQTTALSMQLQAHLTANS